jgi:hypothetical protein
MTPRLTDDQLLAVHEHGGAPIYMIDETTNVTYVLMRVEQFEKMRSFSEDEVPSMYPLIADISPEDWEDASNYENRE